MKKTDVNCELKLTVLCLKFLNALISYKASDTGEPIHEYHPNHTCRFLAAASIHAPQTQRGSTRRCSAATGTRLVAEQLDPETLAYTLVEHARSTDPEPEAFLSRVLFELFRVEPGVLEHVVDKWFLDLTEELSRRNEEDAIRAVLEVQTHWEQEVYAQVLELPRGLWKWLSENARDLARIAGALEKIATEVARIRATLEYEKRKEDRR